MKRPQGETDSDECCPSDEGENVTGVVRATRWLRRVMHILWPKLRRSWNWCVEWAVGLGTWCAVAIRLLLHLVILKWQRLRIRRHVNRLSPTTEQAAEAGAGRNASIAATRTVIDQQFDELRAGPHPMTDLTFSKRVAASAAMLLGGWLLLPTGESEVTEIRNDSPATLHIAHEESNHAASADPEREPVAKPDATTGNDELAIDPIAERLAEAERTRRKALDGLPPAVLEAITNPDADVKSVVDRLAEQAANRRQRTSPSSEILATLSEFEPDVIAAMSRELFLRKYPDARLASRNDADGLENYIWGDNFAENHATVAGGVLIGFHTSFFRGDRRRAQHSIDEIVARLGMATYQDHSEHSPPAVVQVALWNFEELGFSVRCTIRSGKLKNGTTVYWFERGVTNVRLLKEIIKRPAKRVTTTRRNSDTVAASGSYRLVRERVKELLRSQVSESKIDTEASILIELAKQAGRDETSVLKLLDAAEADATRRGLNRAFAVSAVRSSLSFSAASEAQ